MRHKDNEDEEHGAAAERVDRCPHCGNAITLRVRVPRITIVAADAATAADRTPPSYDDGLPVQTKMLLTQLRSSGMYDVIVKVKSIRDGKEISRAPDRFVLTFLRDVSQHVVPRDILHLLADRYHGDIMTYGHNGVSLVLSDGRIVLVIPSELLRGAKNRLGSVGDSVHTSATRGQVDDWIRTRNGYVPGDKQLFLAVLQRESRGGFQIPDRGRHING